MSHEERKAKRGGTTPCWGNPGTSREKKKSAGCFEVAGVDGSMECVYERHRGVSGLGVLMRIPRVWRRDCSVEKEITNHKRRPSCLKHGWLSPTLAKVKSYKDEATFEESEATFEESGTTSASLEPKSPEFTRVVFNVFLSSRRE